MSDLIALPVTAPLLNVGGAVLLERVGPDVGNETPVTTVWFSSRDVHGASATSPLARRQGSPAPALSYERWIRLRFDPPIGGVSALKFWCDNYAPNPGWTVLWGMADIYQRPSGTASSYARAAIPTSVPANDNAGRYMSKSGMSVYSGWIILQASWTGGDATEMQASPLNLRFTWQEC